MRAALEQGRWTFIPPLGYLNALKWSGKATPRVEPKVSRLLLRRLIGPLLLSEDSPRPGWIEGVAEVKTGLLDGLHDVASLSPASWNQVSSWLTQIEAVRQAA